MAEVIVHEELPSMVVVRQEPAANVVVHEQPTLTLVINEPDPVVDAPEPAPKVIVQEASAPRIVLSSQGLQGPPGVQGPSGPPADPTLIPVAFDRFELEYDPNAGPGREGSPVGVVYTQDGVVVARLSLAYTNVHGQGFVTSITRTLV